MKRLKSVLNGAGQREEVINAEIFFAGVIAVFQSEKLHKFVSGAMVLFTTLSLVAIAENKLYKISFPYVWVLPLGLLALLIYAYFFSNFAEHAKIALIRTSIFSSDWNRVLSMIGSLFIIFALIGINYFGVLAGADFSKRFLDQKLLESETIILQKNNLNLLSSSIKQGNFSTYENQIESLKTQKSSISKALENFIKTKNPRKYATLIKRETSKTQKSLAVIDWKIGKLLKDISQAKDKLNKHNRTIVNQSILATKSLTNDIETGQNQNQKIVNNEQVWAKKIAIGGEILDGFFIFLYLLLHRTNPSADNIPAVKKGARKEYIDTSPVVADLEETKSPVSSFILGTNQNNKKSRSGGGKVTISQKKYEEIKEISDRYQEDENHLSQREVIKRFEDLGKSLNPQQLRLYFEKRAAQGEINRPTKNGRYVYQFSA